MPAVPQAIAEAPAQSRFRRGLDVFCDRALLGVVVLIVLWGPLAFGGVPSPAFLVVQGLTILALALWAVRLWAQREFRLLWPSICWAVLFFLLYALVRCRLVVIEYAARKELIQVVVYASLFFIVVNNFHRRESATVIAIALIVLGLALSLFAVFQFATHYPTIWGVPRRAQFITRGVGTYINPNHLAGLLGMTIPLALAYTLMSRFSPTIKVFFAYCVLAMLAGIGVSLSRGGILATGATLFIFCLVLVYQRGYWLPALGILAVLTTVAIVVSMEFESVQRRFEFAFIHGQLADVRTDYWPAAVHIFEDHPLWGGGPGHFDSEFDQYRPRTVQNRPVYAHNDYLNTLSDWGLTGMAIIGVVCIFLYHGAWRIWPAVRKVELDVGAPLKSDKAAFLMGASMGILAILFHSVVDFNMHIPANAVIAVVLMALITAHWRFASDRFWKKPGWIGKTLLTIMMMTAMVWLGAQELRGGREAYWLSRSTDESAPPNSRLAAMKNAYEAEPCNYVTSYNLGEYYRLTSEQGNPGYLDEGRQALQWYAKSMAMNPLDGYVPMRYGMCLDWIGATNQSGPYFDLAEKLDPNNYHVPYYVARHYVELSDFAEAKRWFERSLGVVWNEMAYWSLNELNQKLADPAGLYKNDAQDSSHK